MNLKLWLLPTAAMLAGLLAARTCAEEPLVLELPAARGSLEAAVPLPLHWAGTATAWRLVETGVKPAEGVALPAEVAPAETAKSKRLLAVIPPREGAVSPRRFRLMPAPAEAPATPGFEFKPLGDKSLGLYDAGRPVLVYNFGTIADPLAPSDPRHSRGCFVHPLYGLDGEVLSDSFPKDHYYHCGMFWAWPHVVIAGHEYDLWTHKDIRQKFVAWLCRQTGPAAAVLGVENGWFVEGRKVMTEQVWLTVYRRAGGHRAIDVSLVLIPGDKPVTLRGAEGKSYGGLCLRFAPGKNKKEPAITVPSGLTQADLPDTHLPWADLSSEFPGAAAPSGVALMVHPLHPDYPPTWLTRHYGILCVGWPGVKSQTLPANRPVRLDYRVWIHQNAITPDALKQAYDDYLSAGKPQWK